MAEPQRGILPEPSPNALFSIFRVPEAQPAAASVARIAARLPATVEKLGRRAPGSKLTCVVGFGSEFWDRIREERGPDVFVGSGLDQIDGSARVRDAKLGEADARLHRAERERVVVELELLRMGQGDVGLEASRNRMRLATRFLPEPPRDRGCDHDESN